VWFTLADYPPQAAFKEIGSMGSECCPDLCVLVIEDSERTADGPSRSLDFPGYVYFVVVSVVDNVDASLIEPSVKDIELLDGVLMSDYGFEAD
jgi:hypothetical protein